MDSTLRAGSRQGAARAPLIVVIVAIALTACTFSSTIEARSGPATMGVPQEIELWDCGEAPSGPTIVDFDESLWLPVGADPYELASSRAGGNGPADTGTITLMEPDRAEYRSDRGPVFKFERKSDSFTHEGCVPIALSPDEA